MARFGSRHIDRQETAAALQHPLRRSQFLTLGLGMIVGVGWVTALGTWIAQAGAVGAAFAFMMGGNLILPIALCYAKLAAMIPEPGGEFVYVGRAFGPGAAFAIGWLLLLVYLWIIIFEALSLGWVMRVLLPGAEGPVLYHVGNEAVHLMPLVMGFSVAVGIGFVNAVGAQGAARFQVALVALKFGAITLFLAAAMLFGGPTIFSLAAKAPAVTIAGWLSVLATTPSWFGGFNAMAQAAAEMREPSSLRHFGSNHGSRYRRCRIVLRDPHPSVRVRCTSGLSA